MAPVEIDHVPRSIIAPVKNMKVVDKAMSLPLVSSAYTEVTRVTSPYMESTMTRVSPVVEMVSPMMDSVKTRVEEQLMTHIPTNISETVQTVQAANIPITTNWLCHIHILRRVFKLNMRPRAVGASVEPTSYCLTSVPSCKGQCWARPMCSFIVPELSSLI